MSMIIIIIIMMTRRASNDHKGHENGNSNGDNNSLSLSLFSSSALFSLSSPASSCVPSYLLLYYDS